MNYVLQAPAGSSNNDRARLPVHSSSSSGYHTTQHDNIELQESGPDHDQQPLVAPEGVGGEERKGVGVLSRHLWGLPIAWVCLIGLVILAQVVLCAFAVRAWSWPAKAQPPTPGTPGQELVSENPALGGIQSCLTILQQSGGKFSAGKEMEGLHLTSKDAGVLTCHHYPGFHFRPRGKWMNDPNGPMFYKGMYHLFFQYNPYAPVWGNIQWGHAISPNLVDWLELQIALSPDQWYDRKGVFSGSATILDDGRPAILYTGVTGNDGEVQNLAEPADLLDPYLREWTKSAQNPIMNVPNEVNPKEFRDPSTAWKGGDGKWRVLIGGADASVSDGSALVFESADFQRWQGGKKLHTRAGTGMWECPELFPLPVRGTLSGDGQKHVLKVSLERYRLDCYVVGTYNLTDHSWAPDDLSVDISLAALRYDYGEFYASKSFFDSNHNRTLLWGWVGELSTEAVNEIKGWASIQALPRVLRLDENFNTRLIQMPLPEVEARRGVSYDLVNLTLQPGALLPVEGIAGSELDIEVEFGRPGVNASFGSNLMGNVSGNPEHCCQGRQRGTGTGLFGLLVLADRGLSEQTSVYFEELSYDNGRMGRKQELPICLCTDLSRSSRYLGVRKPVYNTTVPVLSTENALTLRILVDRSVVEVFAQGGRSVITSRAYPQLAVGQDARVFLFNNGSTPVVVNRFQAWQMQSANIS